MKKLISLLLILTLLVSFTACFRKFYSCYSYDVLYDENGNATQLWIYTVTSNNGQLSVNEGVIYEIRHSDDGSVYFEINSKHDHDKKMPIPQDAQLQIDETKNESDLSSDKITIDCLLPTQQGENAYQGTQLVNLYYLDADARNPVLVVTDMVDGVVRSNIIKPLHDMNDECYFLLSNGQGEYTRAIFNYENPTEILNALPDYSLIVETFYFSVLNTVFDGEKPVKVYLSTLGGINTYDVIQDEEGKTYISIETITGELLFIEYNLDSTEQDVTTMSFDDAIVLPSDIISRPEGQTGILPTNPQ